MKKAFSILLAILVLSNSLFVSFAETKSGSVLASKMENEPVLAAEAAVLIDASTGEVLFDKNMNQKKYPASITKIMTALLVLENLQLSSTVTIDKETSLTGGSSIHLSEGEMITVEQLLYALLLKSANDAAVALAKEVAGSVPDFAKMMNARAEELGAENTNFVTPNGLPDSNHYTTAYDIAMIARGAMENSEFRSIVTTLKYTIPKTNKNEARKLHNPNQLLNGKSEVLVNGVSRPVKYDGATGIKNGYTSEAGRCLAASAKRGNLELISVVLKSADGASFGDSIALLDYGFENYKRIPVITEGDKLGTIKVIKGSVNKVELAAARTFELTVPAEETDSEITTKVLVNEKVTAPISKGENLGTVQIYQEGILAGEVDAIALESIKQGGLLSAIGISDRISNCLMVLLFLLAIVLGARLRKRIKLDSRRRA